MSLKLEDVTYTYSPGTAYEMHALEHINLEIPNGQFVGIIGHTGSGKSTLVKLLLRFYDPARLPDGCCITERISGKKDIR